MGFLEGNKIGAALPFDMEPIIGQGFEAGHVYEQVDLDSRAAVEGVARYFKHDEYDPSYFTVQAIQAITEANGKAPGSYIAFAGPDQYETDIAYVYRRIS